MSKKNTVPSILIYGTISIVLVLSLGFIQPLSIAYAHHYDAPGPPPLLRNGVLETIDFSVDPASGDWGAAEVIVFGEAEHKDHTKATFYFAQSQYGKSMVLYQYPFSYTPDCTPADPISFDISVIEADTDAALKDFGQVVMAGGGLIAGASWVSGGGLVVGGVIFVVGAIITGVGSLNGDDNYGKVTITVPTNGRAQATATGPDGSATVHVRGSTIQDFPNTLCPTPSTPPSVSYAAPDNEKEIYVAFVDSLDNAWQGVQTTEAEPGSGITSVALADIQATQVSYLMSAAQIIAASTLRAADGHEGADLAISKFQEGQELLASESYEEAFYAYLDASSLGMEASNNTEVEDSMPLPFELIMIPNYLSTKTGASLSIGGTVLGAGNETSFFEIAGFPETVTYEIVPWVEDPSYFHLQIELGDTPPGTYDGMIYASNGNMTDQSTVTLIVNEKAELGEEPDSPWNPIVAEQPNFNQSMIITGTNQELSYFSSNGTVTSINADPETASLTLDIEPEARGYLMLDLPNSIIEAEPSGNASASDDESFVVLVDGQETGYGASATDDGRIISISYNDTTTQIEIRGSAVTVEIIPDQPDPADQPEPAVYNFDYEDRTFPLEYTIVGGSIIDVQVDRERSSLTTIVESADGGMLTISLDRELIDAKEAQEDVSFVVLVDGNEVEHEELESSEGMRHLNFEIPSGEHSIEVVGTSVIPEFPMALLTLVAAIAAGLILVGRKGLAFRFDRRSSAS